MVRVITQNNFAPVPLASNDRNVRTRLFGMLMRRFALQTYTCGACGEVLLVSATFGVVVHAVTGQPVCLDEQGNSELREIRGVPGRVGRVSGVSGAESIRYQHPGGGQ